jgi:16S rRNA (guanine(966)-N(2))-methyltransferase RsmD
VLDLFAGSGALGLEALSRGASHVTFVERDRGALQALRSNLASLRLEASARVMAEDAVQAVGTLARREERFDAVFMDPPYGAPEAAQALEAIGRSALLRPGGVLVFEHASTDNPPDDPAWRRERTRSYGTVALTVYVPEALDTRTAEEAR